MLESLRMLFPAPSGCLVEVEYSADHFIRLVRKLRLIMKSYHSFADPMQLLLAIHGCPNHSVCFEGFPLCFENLANEEKILSKIMAAVFSEDDTTTRDSRPVRLVLTKRSIVQINIATGESTTILEYAEVTDRKARHTLTVVISAKKGDTARSFRFLAKESWLERRYPIHVE